MSKSQTQMGLEKLLNTFSSRAEIAEFFQNSGISIQIYIGYYLPPFKCYNSLFVLDVFAGRKKETILYLYIK